MAEKKEKIEGKANTQAPAENAPTAAEAPATGGAAAPGTGDAAAGARPVRPTRARGVRAVPYGVAHVRASFNNTMVTITDPSGAILAWSSSGRAGFKGSRKSTAFAATVVAQDAARQALGRGMQEVEVHIQGPGAGRESAIRALQSAGLGVTLIKDVTPMPHGGCRPRKRRRV
jgi:small subunit ribosomal protein S11